MADIIINQNKIVVESKESSLIQIDSFEPATSVVVETQVTEPQVALSVGNTFLSVESAKEIATVLTCGEVISALKFVYIGLDGNAYLGDSSFVDKAEVIGISLTAGNVGQKIKVLMFGRVDDSFFTYLSGDVLYLTNNGNVSTTAPTVGWVKEIGQGLLVGSIFINIKTAITL